MKRFQKRIQKLWLHRKQIKILGAGLLLTAGVSGCTNLHTEGGSGPTSSGIEHTLLGVAYRTVTADLTITRKAVEKTLIQMDMKPGGPMNTEEGARFIAAAPGLDITVQLERITSKLTKISVDVKRRFFRRDKETATEILRMVIQNLINQN